jgi:hypothetical protein
LQRVADAVRANGTKMLSWVIALAVFLVFFGTCSFRLGIEPVFMHDDYEYTYPSFSLVERGNLGSPLLGPAFNLPNRTYHFTAYYFWLAHAGLIRVFADGPQSIPLANSVHFALVATAGAFFLIRRGASVGLSVFLYALVSDDRMIEAARHGRPETTTACCLTVGVPSLWPWQSEALHRPGVLFGLGAALTASMLSHTSLLFFAAARLLAFCLTLRPNTERPITVTEGSNRLTTLPTLAWNLEAAIALRASGKALPRPALWDGCASEPIADALAES